MTENCLKMTFYGGFKWFYGIIRTVKNIVFANKFLKGFKGYMHCDGWSGYDKIENVERFGCWVNLCRYYMNVLEVQENKTDYSTLAGKAVLKIREIFATEKLNPEKPG